MNIQSAVGDQFTALVIHGLQRSHTQGTRAGQTALAVIEVGRLQAQLAFAADQALAVQRLATEYEVKPLLAEQATATVIQADTCKAHASQCTEQPVAVIEELVDSKAQRFYANNPTTVTVVQLQPLETDTARAEYLTATVVDIYDLELHVSDRTDQTVVAVVQRRTVKH
ncbi:hypothetical protein D3C81_1407840 [compost metagenome]